MLLFIINNAVENIFIGLIMLLDVVLDVKLWATG